MLWALFFIFVVVHGQLSIDELFDFNSKYTSTGNCQNFQYNFSDFRIKSNIYNQLVLNCDASTIVFRNKNIISSSLCPDEEMYFENFRVLFPDLSQITIQVNQLLLHGIELCSLDDLIQRTYSEYSYYRSERALLINLKNTTAEEQQHLAIATNGEMTFILSILSTKDNNTLNENKIQIIFPYENIYKFNQLSVHVWRIDQGYVRSPPLRDTSRNYQLSKSTFTLFKNETFFIYGTQLTSQSRFSVSIEGIRVVCKYEHIFQCTFPILSWHVVDKYEPTLQVVYNKEELFNTTLTLIPRTRLHNVSTIHSITNISTFEVNIDPNRCM